MQKLIHLQKIKLFDVSFVILYKLILYLRNIKMKPINWNSLKDKLATQNTEVSKNSNAISYKTYLQLRPQKCVASYIRPHKYKK